MRQYFVLACIVLAAACSSTTPAAPSTTPPVTTPPPVDPGPVVNNTPPVIGKFTVQGTRRNEPPSFADVSEDLPISVEVTDAESAISSLKFNWSSNGVGSFSGTGPNVIWKAPAQVDAPAQVTLTVEVVETYTSQGKTIENKPTASTIVSVHNSVKEVGDLATQFLLDFSDSSKDTPTVMRNFQEGCYGTADETAQVSNNRATFTIIDHLVALLSTTVDFGGFCPFRNLRGDACARVRVYWKSTAKKDAYDDFGTLYARAGQQVEAGPAIDQVAAMYYRDQQRWRLCDSAFDPDHTSLRAASVRGLVP
jgi:hypothetical protein